MRRRPIDSRGPRMFVLSPFTGQRACGPFKRPSSQTRPMRPSPCRRCHQTFVRKLADLPGLLGGDLIVDLHRRLVCKACGFRPSVLNVQVREPTPLPSGKYPTYPYWDTGATKEPDSA